MRKVQYFKNKKQDFTVWWKPYNVDWFSMSIQIWEEVYSNAVITICFFFQLPYLKAIKFDTSIIIQKLTKAKN